MSYYYSAYGRRVDYCGEHMSLYVMYLSVHLYGLSNGMTTNDFDFCKYP